MTVVNYNAAWQPMAVRVCIYGWDFTLPDFMACFILDVKVSAGVWLSSHMLPISFSACALSSSFHAAASQAALLEVFVVALSKNGTPA